MRVTSRIPGWASAAGLVVLLGLYSNGISQYTSVDQVMFGTVPDGVATADSSELIPVPPRVFIGGWPFVFCVRNEYLDRPSFTVWSWRALLGNVFSFTVVLLLFAIYELRTHAIGRRNSGRAPYRRQLNLFDLMLLTALAAGGFSYWKIIGARADAQVAYLRDTFPSNVRVASEAWVPWYLEKTVPKSALKSLRRARQVTVVDPDDQTLSALLQFDSLQKIRIGGGSYDLRHLDKLASLPLLTELRISGRRLDAGSIAAIGRCKQLQSLSLMRTNITAAGVAALGKMPRLRHLNLSSTDVVLRELGSPDVATAVEALVLPHPHAGRGDEGTIEHWPRLQYLTVSEPDTLTNDVPVSLTLRNLPELKTLTLDAFQRFDLALENLPQVDGIALRADQAALRQSKNRAVNTAPWIRNMRCKQVPQLKRITVMIEGLGSLQLQCGPQSSLKLLHAAQNSSAIDSLRGSRPASVSTIPLVQCQRWIESLGDSHGPRIIDLSMLPLDNVKLDALFKNKGIRELDLSHTNLPADEILKLKGMPELENLILQGLQISDSAVEELISHLPALRKMSLTVSTLSSLHLENNDRLERLFAIYGNPTDARTSNAMLLARGANIPGGIKELRLVGMTKLAESFSFNDQLVSLQLDNVPALTGLSFAAPWLKGAILRGPKDLKFFAAGGAELNDTVANEVLRCKDLRKLTWAYSSISPKMLSRLSELTKLEYLVLSGSQVNDEVADGLGGLKDLRILAIDHTPMTFAGIKQLLNLRRLEQLDIEGQWVTPEIAAALPKLGRLTRLAMRGARLDNQSMTKIASMSGLECLDLSDSELSKETLEPVISGFPGLQLLRLNRSKIDEPTLRLIVAGKQNLRLEVTDVNLSDEFYDSLVRHNKIVQDPSRRGIMSPVRYRSLQPAAAYYQIEEGEISVTPFLPSRLRMPSIDRDDPSIAPF